MSTNFWSSLLSILIGLIGLDLLISVHELGHFLIARACHIKVESVSFGFGPKLLQWKRKDTVFKICLIPVGGSTQMAGRKDLLNALYRRDQVIKDCEEGSLYGTKPWKRIITYLAGPVFNLFFAVICYTVLLVIPTVTRTLPATVMLTSDSESYYSQDCAAKEAGLLTGDTITAINGHEINDYFEMQVMLEEAKNSPVTVISTLRGDFSVSPKDGKFGILPGGEYENKVTKGKNVFQALSLAFQECFIDTKNFVFSLVDMFRGRNKISQTIGGTWSTSEMIGEMAAESFRSSFNSGIRTVLFLMASVSISLGFANMLPITALDGGLILISLIEMITKKQWSPKVYIALQITGLAILFVIIPMLRFFF